MLTISMTNYMWYYRLGDVIETTLIHSITLDPESNNLFGNDIESLTHQPLSVPMLPEFTEAYVRRCASMSYQGFQQGTTTCITIGKEI